MNFTALPVRSRRVSVKIANPATGVHGGERHLWRLAASGMPTGAMGDRAMRIGSGRNKPLGTPANCESVRLPQCKWNGYSRTVATPAWSLRRMPGAWSRR